MITKPAHHPHDDLIVGHACGALDSATALVVATHCAYCPRCAQAVARYETIGGAMLENVAPAPLSDGSLEKMLALLDQEVLPAVTAPEPIRTGDPDLIRLPAPVRDIALAAADKNGWRNVLPGIKSLNLDLHPEKREQDDKTEIQLFRLSPGKGTPRHTHGGLEYTLVLTGAFKDESGLYNAGDLSVATPDMTHRPIAMEGEDCIALAVTTAPLRFTGLMGLVQRSMGQ